MSELEDLRKRLVAAELVCVAYAGTPARPKKETDSEKALTELWQQWFSLPTSPALCHRKMGILPDQEVERLARKRDQTVRRTLTRIQEVIPE